MHCPHGYCCRRSDISIIDCFTFDRKEIYLLALKPDGVNRKLAADAVIESLTINTNAKVRLQENYD